MRGMINPGPTGWEYHYRKGVPRRRISKVAPDSDSAFLFAPSMPTKRLQPEIGCSTASFERIFAGNRFGDGDFGTTRIRNKAAMISR
jgi:hypothetical protein